MVSLASDDFNRANENPLSGGGNWSVAQSPAVRDPALVSNKVQNGNPIDDGSDANANYGGVSFPDDQYSQADLTASSGYTIGDGPGLGLRMSNTAQTYYRIIVNHITGGNNVRLAKVVTGGVTTVGDRNSGAWTDGATWYAEVSGTTFTIKLSGSAVGTTLTDSAISTGRTGITYSSEGASLTGTWDNWDGGDLTVAALPPGLGPNTAMDEPALNIQCQVAMMR